MSETLSIPDFLEKMTPDGYVSNSGMAFIGSDEYKRLHALAKHYYEMSCEIVPQALALHEALWQLLDDMGEDGLCVCQAAKDQALKALKAACPDDRGEEAAKTSADDAQ